jgi:hypothetical protein
MMHDEGRMPSGETPEDERRGSTRTAEDEANPRSTPTHRAPAGATEAIAFVFDVER